MHITQDQVPNIQTCQPIKNTRKLCLNPFSPTLPDFRLPAEKKTP
jgi:hypothetical protein